MSDTLRFTCPFCKKKFEIETVPYDIPEIPDHKIKTPTSNGYSYVRCPMSDLGLWPHS